MARAAMTPRAGLLWLVALASVVGLSGCGGCGGAIQTDTGQPDSDDTGTTSEDTVDEPEDLDSACDDLQCTPCTEDQGHAHPLFCDPCEQVWGCNRCTSGLCPAGCAADYIWDYLPNFPCHCVTADGRMNDTAAGCNLE